MPSRSVILALALLCGILVGCEKSGPVSTHTNSAGIPTLQERINFLHQYVSFRRTYESLDFDLYLKDNGGGMVPGPSDWDFRIVATVPEAELSAWIPPDVSASATTDDRGWLNTVPTTLDLSGVNEWYPDGSRLVGIDRVRRIVVYRLRTN